MNSKKVKFLANSMISNQKLHNDMIKKFNRFEKLSDVEQVPLVEGIDPPAQRMSIEYKGEPGNPRECIHCGKIHDTVLFDTRTGEKLAEMYQCRGCLLFAQNPPKTQIIT